MTALLGIIGGMGTPAGLRFAQYVVDEAKARGAVTDTDFPRFVLYNDPSWTTNETGTDNLSAFKTHLVTGIRKMSEMGCTTVVVACNTAHLYLSDMRELFRGSIPDMIGIGCRSADPKLRKVGVICSETSRTNRIYLDALSKMGFEPIAVCDDDQEILNDAIKAAISDRQTEPTTKSVMEVVSSLAKRGAQQVIVGCTELPLVVDWKHSKIPLIDPGRATIRAALDTL